MRVFISYRRDDSMVTAALLYRELTSRPEFADAFMDIDDIGYGDDFVAAIDAALQQADVVLVVIGPKWAEMLQARLRGDDWVRHEVATALRLRDGAARPGRPALRVVPVLIGGAVPPAAVALPPDLAPLARLGMLAFDERALKASINSLLETLQEEGFEARARRLQDERRRVEGEHLQIEGERTNRTRGRVAAIAVGCALFLGASVHLFDLLGLQTRIATATMLLAHVAARSPAWSGVVVLVGIDEASERTIGKKWGPDWRAEHATFIARAASAAARTVAFDVVLEDEGKEEANAALARALKEAGKKPPVVFGVQSRGPDGAGFMREPFAALARPGIACAGIALGQSHVMPLAVLRAHAPATAASAASSGDDPPRDDEPILTAAFALAAYGGGGRAQLLNEGRRPVLVRLQPLRRTQTIEYFDTLRIDEPQPGCEALAPGDSVFVQLIDPYSLPPLAAPPQRIAYESVVNGDPATLALLKDRIVVVGTMLRGSDRFPLPWPAADRWGVELFAAQVDAMARDVAIRPVGRLAEWSWMNALALVGAVVGHRLRDRSRVKRVAVLATIAVIWGVAAVAWYHATWQLIGVPYDIVALFLGAWLANRNWRRPTA